MKLTEKQKCRTDIKYKKKIFKVFPGEGLNPCCEDDLKNIIPWLEEAMPGETVKISILEMTQEEYDALPEYIGP